MENSKRPPETEYEKRMMETHPQCLCCKSTKDHYVYTAYLAVDDRYGWHWQLRCAKCDYAISPFTPTRWNPDFVTNDMAKQEIK